MFLRLIKILLLVLVYAFMAFGQSNGIISDEIIVPPNYSSFVPEDNIGSEYIDPAFGTKVKRITNCGLIDGDALGGYFSNSEICAFNVDGSYFIATENIETDGIKSLAGFLYDGNTGERIKLLGRDTMRPWYIRWAIANKYKKDGEYIRFEPKYCFYRFIKNEIRLYDIRDVDNYVVLRTFPEYYEIGPAGGEGDLSDDGRYWCLDGNSSELFVYDLIDDIKYPETQFNIGSLGGHEGTGVDYAAVSPTGRYVVIAWAAEPSEQQFHGVEVYDLEWNFQRQIHPDMIHWDLGIDAFGHEVMYTTAGFGVPEFFTKYGIQPGDVISIRLEDGYMRLLKRIDRWAHQVITACNSVTTGDYFYISFTDRSLDPDKLWAPFWGEIVEIPTDGSQEVRRLVHHRSRPVSDKPHKYWQPDAVVNRQGTKILFRSTFTHQTADLYLMNVGNRYETSEDSTPPNMPQELQSPTQTHNKIDLQWKPPLPAKDGDVATYYQVFRNDVQIEKVYETKYTDTGLEEGQSYSYKIYAVDKSGLKSLEPAIIQVSTTADLNPPQVDNLQVLSENQLSIVFSEVVNPLDAESVYNYNISHDVMIKSASLLQDGRSVVLVTSNMLTGIEYQLKIENIRDLSQNSNQINLTEPLLFRVMAVFFDDFEDSQINSWLSLTPDKWNVIQESNSRRLYLGDSNYESPGGNRLGEYSLVDETQFVSTHFSIEGMIKSAEDIGVNHYADFAFVFGYIDSLNYYYVQFHSYDLVINEIRNGERFYFSKIAGAFDIKRYSKYGITVNGDNLQIYYNDERVYTETFQLSQPGKIGVGSFNDAVYFDDIRVKTIPPLDNTPPAAPAGLNILPLP